MNSQADAKAMKLMCFNKAKEMWKDFTANEQTAVRIGMFPADKMQEAIAQGHDSRLLSVALMDLASKNGGMIA